MFGLGQVRKRDAFKYAVLPEVRPRFMQLFMSGFNYIPYFIALVYQAVRLLPQEHPYGNPANIGQFGIRHVIGEAGNNLVISFKNIDQILLFACILIGMLLIFAQFCLLATAIMFQPALAAMPTNFNGFFLTQNPEQDIAHMMLDLVFGVPDLFNSCVAKSVPCLDMDGNPLEAPVIPDAAGPLHPSFAFPFPIHVALHQMFALYSEGLLVVAFFIATYFIITILAETAQTGTPFGKRFNKVWVPFRLVMAFGLLVPVGSGLNSSQYIVLYAAKFGSGFATNGWALFNTTLTGTYLGNVNNLVSKPNIPEVSTLLQFFYTARTCAEAEKVKYNRDIKPYLVKSPLLANPFLEVTSSTSYAQAVNFSDGETVMVMRFGEDPNLNNNKKRYGRYQGFVKPICGEVQLTLTDPRIPSMAEDGPEILQKYYFFLLQDMWFRTGGTAYGVGLADPFDVYPENTVKRFSPWNPDPTAALPPQQLAKDMKDFYTNELEDVMTTGAFISSQGAIQAAALSTTWDPTAFSLTRGWAGAGIWYNRVAELNGAVTTAVFNVPKVTLYPYDMEYVRQRKAQGEQEIFADTMFEPTLLGNKDIPADTPAGTVLAAIYYQAYKFWQNGGGLSTTHTNPTDNIIIDAINVIFGTEGLYSIRRNPDVHPLAQLVGVGKSLVESSIRNLGAATLGGAAGASLATILGPWVGKAAGTAASFAVTIAMIGLTAGFVLYYVVPFLPFIYFFFAVGGWIKGIFEAMVGAPLWALAHIRIDGNGLPGQAAVNGYFLIFEIFLRPILIIFGLLAGISIFSALVMVLNDTFKLVTDNLAGFDARNTNMANASDIEFYRAPVDEFFFTIIYTVLVYLIGMSSFKLIDLIPNNILRWMGQSVATFGDQREDPASGLVGKASIGAQQTVSSIGGSLKGLVGGKAES